MDDPVFTEYVIRELARNVSKNDLIYDLCQRTGLSWDQVSNFVSEVEYKHHKEIAKRSSPILFVIGIAVFLGGAWLGCGALFFFFDFFRAGSVSLNPFDLRRDYVSVIRLGTGLAMMVGSAIGMFQLIRSILGPPAPRA